MPNQPRTVVVFFIYSPDLRYRAVPIGFEKAERVKLKRLALQRNWQRTLASLDIDTNSRGSWPYY